jgi:hypothetical protein
MAAVLKTRKSDLFAITRQLADQRGRQPWWKRLAG